MTSDEIKPKRWRKRFDVLIRVLVCIVVVGHLSNIVSLQAAETKVVSWYVQEFTDGLPLRFSQGQPMSSVLYYSLLRVDAEMELLTPDEWKKSPYPSCSMEPAQPVCPFIIGVRFDHIEGGLGGAGGRIYVVSFFGASVVVWHQTDWVA